MEMIKTPAQLQEKVAACSACLDGKFKGENGKRAVVLCGGTGYLSSNSAEIREKFQQVIDEKGLHDKVSVNQVGCFGFCSQGPFCKIFPEGTLYRMVKLEDVEEIVEKDLLGGEIVERLLYVDPATGEKVQRQDDINFYKKQCRIALHGCGTIDPENIEEALGYGGYQGLAKALTMDRQEVINEVLKAGLRGRGGGFPTGRKWQFAYNEKGDEKYVICNGDEGDPGAFMDRSILEGNPLAVIEGMVIAGYAIGAKNGYFYIRAEYPVAVRRLRIAIKEAKEIGLLGEHILGSDFSFDVHIRLGAGAFVCGEETALLNSIEGKGEPDDITALEELVHVTQNGSLCALGQTAANPVKSTMTHFMDEYLAHINDKKCPAHVCKTLMQYKIVKDKCFGCGMCAKQCPASAISRTDYAAPGRKLAAMEIDPAKCVKCGACMSTCKFKAIIKE